MSAHVVTFKDRNPNDEHLIERKEYYANAFDKYDAYYPWVIDTLVFTPNGKIILQKRGYHKAKSPGELHTTIGGHVDPNETPEATLIHESIEEIGVAPTLFPNEETFWDITKKIKPYLSTGVFMFEANEGYRKEMCTWDKDDTPYCMKDRYNLYLGVTSHPLQNLDNSAVGFEYLDWDLFLEQAKKTPRAFTKSMLLYIDDNKSLINNFVQKLKSL